MAGVEWIARNGEGWIGKHEDEGMNSEILMGKEEDDWVEKVEK